MPAARRDSSLYDFHPDADRILRRDVHDRHGRQPTKSLAPKYFYDDARQRVIRSHLRSARVLPHAHRAHDDAGRQRGDDGGAVWATQLPADRIRQPARAVKTARADARRWRPAAYMAGRHFTQRRCVQCCATNWLTAYPAVTVAAVCADYTRPLETARGWTPMPCAPPRDLFSGIDHWQFHARRGAGVFASMRAPARGAGRRHAGGRGSEKRPRGACMPPTTTRKA